MILFWALDSGNLAMLRYLWTFGQTSWGVRNLEYMLGLAEDLSSGPQDYPLTELYSVLLDPETFARILRQGFSSDISEAMDFIEEHVVSNSALD